MISGTLPGNVPGRRAGFKPGNLPYLKKVIVGLDLAGDALTTHLIEDSDLVGEANDIFFPKKSIKVFSDEAVSGSIDYNVLLNGSYLFSADKTIASQTSDLLTPDQNTPQRAKSHKVQIEVTTTGDVDDTLSIRAWPRIE